MRLTSIIVCGLLLGGFVVSSPQTACAQAKDAGKQQAKDAEKQQAKKTEGTGEGKYVVWVYKSEGGKWVKQPERTFNTDDTKAANDYVAQVWAVDGWTATTNAPEPPPESVVGTWVGVTSDGWGSYVVEATFSPDGSCHYNTRAGGTMSGTWRQSGNTIHEEYPVDALGAGGPSDSTIRHGVKIVRGVGSDGKPVTSTLKRKK